MKCGPDGCPIVAFSDLTPAEQREQRARKAKEMSERGFTQEQIAKQYGVSRSTIESDLSNLTDSVKLKPAKTASNPKGAGRPKGSSSTRKASKDASDAPKNDSSTEAAKFAKAYEVVLPRVLAGQPYKTADLAQEYGLSVDTFERAKLAAKAVKKESANPVIDPASLSMTAQEKLNLAIKQATRKLEVEIEQRIRAEMWRWLNDDLLPVYRKKEQHYNLIVARRTGIMKRPEYRSILSCLHPDRVQDEQLQKRYAHAFNLFTKLEKLVLDEKESPTDLSSLPKSAEELLKRRAEYDARRAAERATKRSKQPVARRH